MLFRTRAVAAMLEMIKADLALLGIRHDLFSSEAELQAAKLGDVPYMRLLLANGANIVAMQSYDNMRGYFENALVDNSLLFLGFRLTDKVPDASTLSQNRRRRFAGTDCSD